MYQVSQNELLRQHISEWRTQGLTVAFVPTMGNLHEGHLSLVDAAKAKADKVVVSIFVNPMQFGANEDLDSYPRTLAADAQFLRERGADLLYLPTESTIYPKGLEAQTTVDVPGITDCLCGASRPGHFRGVTTVVAKLFNLVQPDFACFGMKDFQQLQVIRTMVADLAMPIEIVAVPTARHDDGLAMSSRNGYLTEEERAIAPLLQRQLQALAEQLRNGADIQSAVNAAIKTLNEQGFEVDYLEVRRTHDLALASFGDTDLVIFAAAFLGKPRLIDNLPVQLS
ncbi:pantoate--beta-alanine ligase [Paraferrimonas sedimenticola]|uniref:Pantothenate synthetase n=1 Tax=Paraferrimonas sedimenticola TaxID=375674 RepID=A0AA37RUX3_9GAMM|nr:pantoate--beta-alanine ligase [Paraferrimonas sedimenticola]GLP95633.1 pantothenate synthetase [Paraferrimonas sedimenticola]